MGGLLRREEIRELREADSVAALPEDRAAGRPTEAVGRELTLRPGLEGEGLARGVRDADQAWREERQIEEVIHIGHAGRADARDRAIRHQHGPERACPGGLEE